MTNSYSFTRYLAAKKSVDDRALNRHVWESLKLALPLVAPKTPLRVLEVGAGIGTMIERALSWGLLTQASYTAIDAEPDNIAEARRRLPRWAARENFVVTETDQGSLHFAREGQNLMVALETIDLFDFMAREQGQQVWDVLIAHAFLDLVNVPAALPRLLSLLRPGGLFYFSIVFDGATILQPDIDPGLDAQIVRLYHQTMDERLTSGQPSGDSQTGRHLFSHLRAAGAELLDAGSSDWTVFAGLHGYPADEAYFLHFIVQTIYTALASQPNLASPGLADWITRRHAQIDRGELVYLAHQLDFLGHTTENENLGNSWGLIGTYPTSSPEFP